MRWKIFETKYLGYILGFVASLMLIFATASNAYLDALFSVSAVFSICGGVFQLFRDQLAFDRSVSIQAAQNSFELGSSSHMANVAFNKHVEFCEAYSKEAHATFVTLFKEGPSPNALAHARKLTEIREIYFVWLTVAIDGRLDKLEAALRKIGASAQYVIGKPGSDASQKVIAEMYRAFANLMGAELMGHDVWEDEKLSEEEAMKKIIMQFRIILGTEELTKLRNVIIQKALTS